MNKSAAVYFCVLFFCSATMYARSSNDPLFYTKYPTGSLCWNEDGSRYGYSDDNDFIMLDAGTDRVVRTFPLYDQEKIVSAAIAEDYASEDDLALLLGQDGTLVLWSLAEDVYLEERKLPGSFKGQGMAFSRNGGYIAVGLPDHNIRLYMRLRYTDRFSEFDLEGHKKEVYSLAFSPDGKYLASASKDKTIRIWELETGRCVSVLPFYRSLQAPVLYTADSLWIVSCEHADEITVRDMRGATDRIIPLKRNAIGFDLSSDGNTLRVFTDRGRFEYYDFHNGAFLGTIPTHQTDEIFLYDYAFSPDGETLLCSYTDGSFYRYTVADRFKAEKNPEPRAKYPSELANAVYFDADLGFTAGTNVLMKNFPATANLDVFFTAKIPRSPVFLGLGAQGLFAFPKTGNFSAGSAAGFSLYVPLGLSFQPARNFSLGVEARAAARFLFPASSFGKSVGILRQNTSFALDMLGFINWKGFSVYAGGEYDTINGWNFTASVGYTIRFNRVIAHKEK